MNARKKAVQEQEEQDAKHGSTQNKAGDNKQGKGTAKKNEIVHESKSAGKVDHE